MAGGAAVSASGWAMPGGDPMSIDPKFIVTLPTKSGPKPFILLAGLLDAGHSSGLIGIECSIVPELCQPEKDMWVSRAVGRFMRDGVEQVWAAMGDAHSGNSQMKGAYLRHAETRAVARMLRFATNIGMTAAEEMGPDYDDEREIGAPRPASNGQPPRQGGVSAARRTNYRTRAQADQPLPATGTGNGVVGNDLAGPLCTVDGCGMILTEREISGCMQKAWPLLCMDHARAKVKAEREVQTAADAP